MIPTTLKMVLNTVSAAGGEASNLNFGPDYADGANAEWAVNTPSASLYMNLVQAQADQFEAGKKYTVTITETPAA